MTTGRGVNNRTDFSKFERNKRGRRGGEPNVDLANRLRQLPG